MKIRNQLIVLVVAAIAPVAIFAAITTLQLLELRRVAYEQRFLERVSALRLVLDTEIDGMMRSLRLLAESPDLGPKVAADRARYEMERLILNRPGWVTIGLLGTDGKMLARIDRGTLQADLVLDAETAQQVRDTKAPAVSNLILTDRSDILVTFLAMPVMRRDTLYATLYLGIEHRHWLDLLRSHLIVESATLTLNDRNGNIITRTLDDDRWAGTQSTTHYRSQIQGRAQGVLRNIGVDGQHFYSAFSQLNHGNWTLGTGVPQSDVDAELARPTVLLALGVVAAALGASLLAWFLGRRVAATVTQLAQRARSLASTGARSPMQPLPIAEAETIRLALEEASVLLEARERSLSDAVNREARSRALAEHANQSKDQFLAMLGHELRNPISAISAAVAVLEVSERDHATHGRARDIVRRQLRHLTEIVNELLDVARLNTGKVALNRQVMDLADMAVHVVSAFREAGRCQHLTVETVLEPVDVLADETRIEQVIGNLLDNACKYTPQGGHVTVSVGAEGADAVFTCRDDGHGMSPDLLPHVFDVFAQGQRTLDRSQGGLGLGLTVVRRLVEFHGGSVSVASEGPGRGSTFTVRLPRAQSAPAGRSNQSPQEPLLRSVTARRIVLVEDNADSREVVAALLRMQGHEVTIAVDGPGGVAAIMDGNADVALVDIGLPGFDGIELARRVRAGDCRLILIALTGYSSAEDRRKALDAGFDAFLVKPFDATAFESAVAGAAARRS